jgi:hypothetical protein
MTKTGLEFRILVIVICLIFEICDLEFLFLHYSHETHTVWKRAALVRQEVKSAIDTAP